MRQSTSVFRGAKPAAEVNRSARQTVSLMASHLANAAQHTSLDLGDERTVEVFLIAQGWADSAVDAYLADAIEEARGHLARGRLASFIGDAIAAAVILGGGLFFFALTTFDARAGQATPARLSELKFWLWVGGGAVAFILLFALATMRLSGTIASEEEARDPVNYRRS